MRIDGDFLHGFGLFVMSFGFVCFGEDAFGVKILRGLFLKIKE